MTTPADPPAPEAEPVKFAAIVQAPDVAAAEPGVLWCAMRYALGRATYAVGEVCDAIEAHAAELAPGVRERMAREIAEAVADDRAGMDMDVKRWTAARAALLSGEEEGGSPAAEELLIVTPDDVRTSVIVGVGSEHDTAPTSEQVECVVRLLSQRSRAAATRLQAAVEGSGDTGQDQSS